MRHARTLLFLAAITALLALIVVFEPGRESAPASIPLTPLETAGIARLHIERPDQPGVDLERRGSHWWLTAPWPVAVPALDYRVESVLGLLSAPREHSQPAAELDLAQFELDAPTLVLESGAERLAFGNAHPITRERHVLRGDEVHRIADFHFAAIDVDPADWVATAAIPPDVHLERIELPGRVLVLAPPAPGPDGTDPAAAALAWSGPQGEGELPAKEVANAWREARAWRVELVEHWDSAEAGAHSPTGNEVAAAIEEDSAPEAAAATTGSGMPTFTSPALGALDAASTTPITGAADVVTTGPVTGATNPADTAPLTGTLPGERIRLAWDQGGADFRIVKREPELVLARDDAGLAWVFEGPEARLLLGLAVDPTGGEADASTGPGAAGALPGLNGEHLHAH